MRILFANWALQTRAGTETYLETVAPELIRMGHDVVAWSFEQGAAAERLEQLGCATPHDLDEIDDVDVIHAQQASSALATRARFPEAPMVYACHSWALAIDEPPPLAAPAALLAFNDRVVARLEASAISDDVPIHRLRQPVRTSAMEGHRIPIRDHLGSAVALSRSFAERIPLLDAACRQVGANLRVHTDSATLDDSESEIMSADVVFCTGRTALEAMALARAAFVLDEVGCVGFITADRYAALESSGFDVALGAPTTVESLVAALHEYDRELGILGRELAVRHHSSQDHAAQLVAIYRSVLTDPPRSAGTREAIAELGAMEQRVFQLEQRLRQLEWSRATIVRNAIDLVRELERLHSSTSWRITRPLRALRRRPDDHT
jgi:hypothetical protein